MPRQSEKTDNSVIGVVRLINSTKTLLKVCKNTFFIRIKFLLKKNVFSLILASWQKNSRGNGRMFFFQER